MAYENVKRLADMKEFVLRQYVVDAFTDRVFKGNPATFCVLETPLADDLMQKIAKENNLSETAFVVSEGNDFNLRWFTPGGEIDLCGHATLASAYVLMRFFVPETEQVSFRTKSGRLTVKKKGDLYEMDMPAYQLTQVPVTPEMEQAIGVRPVEARIGRDLVCVLETEEQVICATPDLDKVKKLDGLLLQITSRGKEYDCVTRSFAPKLKVAELSGHNYHLSSILMSGQAFADPIFTAVIKSPLKKSILFFFCVQKVNIVLSPVL